MHHQDFSGDPTGSRKTAFHYRRGSSGASASSSAGSGGVNSGDDNPTQAGSSSPAPHHQPLSQVTGAQVKKKSGFQITSVTSAQINVSGNNSLADDTESYDDLDESHTEDLSSDMLDVSVPRTMDTGLPERSSSDETLNSLYGVETPGLVSPNEPLQPHGTHQHTSMVNGSVHHQYYPQQHSHHHSDSLGGGEPSLPTLTPLGTSSPAPASKSGLSQPHRPVLLENAKPPVGTNHASAPSVGGNAAEPHQPGGGNISSMAAVIPPPTAVDITNVAAQGAGGGASLSVTAPPNSQIHHTQTQTATASRFRVVKLDTNSEPFRKGRWTCTEYYEKEIPHPTAAEAQKGADVAGEPETGTAGVSQSVPAVQLPHTLQPYQPPSQDFTSPQAVQSPPQGLTQTTPLSYVSPPEVVGAAPAQKPGAPLTFSAAPPQSVLSQPPLMLPHQLPSVVDPQQAEGGFSAGPQLHAGLMAAGGVRQPDFIQPTAPFQTQVQSLQPHITAGPPVTPVPAIAAVAQQLPTPRQAPPAQATFTGLPQSIPAQISPQPQVHAPSTVTPPGVAAHGAPSVPLTAVLQPLLTPGAAFPHVPGAVTFSKSSHLEDAQKLLFQHQGLLGLPRLSGGEGMVEAGGSVGSLAHMGMSAEASAFMAAAAAGFRAQHEGGEDREMMSRLLFVRGLLLLRCVQVTVVSVARGLNVRCRPKTTSEM
ncbi:TSC22 domain family protein 1 [Takifugu flavidus]|uniref:TSC22 domain family protein 1 n=1 Tax=Takifugu flavidus TaxID=433684 RepID=A0A5C6N9R7_9TELE|nr:TSC22 domain family protein 1 [Takifugu flavidus]